MIPAGSRLIPENPLPWRAELAPISRGILGMLVIKLPKKEYLYFPELVARWGCTNADLFHMIATDQIRPSAIVREKCQIFRDLFKDDGEGKISRNPVCMCDEEGNPYVLNGVYYAHNLRWPTHRRCSTKQFKDAGEVPDQGGEYYEVGNEISIELDLPNDRVTVSDNVVFTLEAIEFVEGCHAENTADEASIGPENHDVEINQKERNTLLLMIAGLAKKAGIDHTHASSATSISTEIDTLGAAVSAPTVRKKLNLIPDVLARREVVAGRKKRS